MVEVILQAQQNIRRDSQTSTADNHMDLSTDGSGSENLPSYAEMRYQDGLECATRATQYDQAKQFSVALTFYSEAVEALSQACSMDPKFQAIQGQLTAYNARAEEIRRYLSTKKGDNFEDKPRLRLCY